ncbi:MAG TPA: hypothetical protein VMF07_16720 [Solirubrobacteraceae bacterium]|nr:hypothetical protein [Solirubrobacteraceae bacterium]
MRAPGKIILAATLTASLTGAAALATTATGRPEPQVIQVTVPINAVHAHETDTPPKGPSPGDGFQASYVPARPTEVLREDLVGIGTFGRGVGLATIQLRHGEIVYAGSTRDQDNTVYAILGGTGIYLGATGSVTTHTISRSQVQLTIATQPH